MITWVRINVIVIYFPKESLRRVNYSYMVMPPINRLRNNTRTHRDNNNNNNEKKIKIKNNNNNK